MAFGPYNERLEGGGSYLPMLEGGIEPGMTENMFSEGSIVGGGPIQYPQFSNIELRGGGPSNLMDYLRPPMMEGVNRDYPEASNLNLIMDRMGGLLGYLRSLRGYGPIEGEGNNPAFNKDIGQSGTGDNPSLKDYPQY